MNLLRYPLVIFITKIMFIKIFLILFIYFLKIQLKVHIASNAKITHKPRIPNLFVDDLFLA